jgi:hypothetical protein
VKTRTLVSYGISILLLCFLIEAIWGAVGGAIAGLTFAKNPVLQQQTEVFFKQRGLTPSTHAEVKTAIEKLSPEDQAAFERMVADALKGSPIGGFWMAFFVSAAAFGIAALVAGYFGRVWQYAWALLLASAFLNNPFRRFTMLAEMPVAQKAVVVVVAQLGVSFGAAWIASKIARRRAGHVPTEPLSQSA